MTNLKICLLTIFAVFCTSSVKAQYDSANEISGNEKPFKIFQFPKNQMPRIDGKSDDWEIVPNSYEYGNEMLKDTEDGLGSAIDHTNDLDVSLKVGWVEGLNRLYFLYEATDDFWDFGRFSNKGYLNDIFEIVIDGDLSGGPFIYNPAYTKEDLKWDSKSEVYLENHFTFSGVHAQNYHIYTPPVNNAWVLIWGNQHWIGDFPQSNYAYDYNFEPGDGGKLVLEFWVTPYDYAPYEGPEKAIESELIEGGSIGLSWSILDFDGGEREGHFNLSHDVRMVKDASFLRKFKLMPIESELRDLIKVDWSFEVIDMEKKRVAFRDESQGEILKWEWDFGDGNYSNEQHPIHQFKEKGIHKVVTLTVEGPAGKSKHTKYWEVMIR
ncbi:PKD domain-containing protein [Cyclobacterium sediminis]